MSVPAFIADPEEAPYNVAYIVDDRSHCYQEYDVDRELDDVPAVPERDTPADYPARREAIIDFYGGRCGRCGTAIARQSSDDVSLAYLYSVAADDDPTWALSHLVAVCEPCYDMLEAECCDELGAFGDTFRRAPQFPSWTCDPRVAVERRPLTGREAWMRAQLADRIPDTPTCRANDTVARRACLARQTPAATAVALGDALVRDERGALSTANRRLRDHWNALAEHERYTWNERAIDPDTALVSGPFEPAIEHHPV
jgi:hypothetical protein